jgi:hypothetical protein
MNKLLSKSSIIYYEFGFLASKLKLMSSEILTCPSQCKLLRQRHMGYQHHRQCKYDPSEGQLRQLINYYFIVSRRKRQDQKVHNG